MLGLKEMRTKSKEDLVKQSLKLREKLANLRKDLLVNDVKENSQIRKVRKDIARIETLLKENELSENKGDKS